MPYWQLAGKTIPNQTLSNFQNEKMRILKNGTNFGQFEYFNIIFDFCYYTLSYAVLQQNNTGALDKTFELKHRWDLLKV